MLCALEKSELNIAAQLYVNTYNVNEAAAAAVLEGFANTVLAQKDEGVITAVLCVSKFNMGDSAAALLHGAAYEDEKYKNQISALIQYAKDNVSADNYIIIDLDEKEIKNQENINTVSARVLTREIKRNLWAKADFDTVTAKKLIQHREKYIKEKYVKLSVQQTAALMTFLYSQGISSAETEKAYALYFRTPDSLAVAELYAETDVDAWFLLEAMADHEGRNTAQLILSENNTIFAGEGKRFKYAGYSGSEIEKNNIYIGPMPK